METQDSSWWLTRLVAGFYMYCHWWLGIRTGNLVQNSVIWSDYSSQTSKCDCSSFKFSLGSIIFQSSAFNNIVKVLKTFWPSSELPNPDHVENSYWLHNIFFVSDIYCGPYEKMLLKHLLYDYERQNRPVLNETEPLVLTFGITLQQIIDVVTIVSLHISYMIWWVQLVWTKQTSV